MKLIDFIYCFLEKCNYDNVLVELDNMDLPFSPRRTVAYLVNEDPPENEKKWLDMTVLYITPSLYSEKRSMSCEFVSRIVLHIC